LRATKAAAPGAAARTTLLVAGMHRSGTSLVAGVLAQLGAVPPKTLMAATASNPAGYWESEPIARFNERLLTSALTSWSDWAPFDIAALPRIDRPALAELGSALIAAEFGTARLFAFKDPRLCRLLPFWLDVLARCGIGAVIVLPIRSPAEVAASLAARDGLSEAHAGLLWLRHVLEAERASRGRRRAFLTYDQLLADWRGAMSELEARLGIEWPHAVGRVGAAIDALVEASHRHHRLPADALNSPTVREWAANSYEILQRWAAVGEDRRDRRALDAIRQELDRHAALALELLTPLRTAAEDLVREREARTATERLLAELRAVHEQTVKALLGAYDSLALPAWTRHSLLERLVERSSLVDGAWYLEQNSDVASAGMMPARHFALFGYREGRPPRPPARR
jgi:hypothetical protein